MSAVAITGIPASIPVAPGIGHTLGFFVENNCSGGVSGNTVSAANSGGSSGRAWDSVVIGTSPSAIQYSNTVSHGVWSGGIVQKYNGGGVNTIECRWTTSSTLTGGRTDVIYLRSYIYIVALPTPAGQTVRLMNANAHGWVNLESTGKITVRNTSFAILQTSSTVLAINTWYRLEAKFFYKTSGNGAIVECKIFTSPDSTTAAETLTGTGFNSTLGTIGNSGFMFTNANSNEVCYQTGFGASNKSYMGPMRGLIALADPQATAAATFTGVAGTVHVGTGAKVHGNPTPGSHAGGQGHGKAGAKSHGVSATITFAGGHGGNGVHIAGIPAHVTITSGIGFVKTSVPAQVTGVAAQITTAGQPGSVHVGVIAKVTGTAAHITTTDQPGAVHSGSKIVTGHAASITATGQFGSIHTGAKVHGVPAVITVLPDGRPHSGAHIPGVNVNFIVEVQSGIGRGHIGLSIAGIAAQATFNPGTGIEHSGAGQQIPGVPAFISVTGGHGIPFSRAIITGVSAHAVIIAAGMPATGAVITGSGSNIVATVTTASPRLSSGHPNPLSILDSIKKVIGMDPEIEVFDLDILLFINTTLVELRRMGVAGNAIQVTDRSQLWSDFWPHELGTGMIQAYVYLSVRLAFDIPDLGFSILSIEDQMKALEFRLKVLGEEIDAPSVPQLI